jgi:Heparan-alpha-glucosaminide N-acetyltransferase, catalytic
MDEIAPSGAPGVTRVPVTKPGRKRLIGIDAARGLALIGLIAIHILPDQIEETGEPTLAFTLFAGDSAALFALLAGVGLALSSGGSNPHRGRTMTAGRVGLAVRAVIIGIVSLVIAALMPEDPPVNGILLYYAVFFLLTIPFLSMRSPGLFLSAAAFAVISPILIQILTPVLPESSAWNHTLVTVLTEPAGTLSELLLTGSYPALTFMAFILAGLGLGRLDLRSTRIQAIIAAIGAAMAVLANLVSSLLLYAFGGYQALWEVEDMTMDELHEELVFGVDTIYDTSAWWQAVATPHAGTTLAIASSLGTAMAVLGVFLLIGSRYGRWLTPLAAMGAMTLTLYSAHLIALIPGVHEDEPALWFVVHVGVAAAFAWFWHRSVGRGPLERVVHRGVNVTRTAIEGAGKTDAGQPIRVVVGGNGTASATETAGDSISRQPMHSPGG